MRGARERGSSERANTPKWSAIAALILGGALGGCTVNTARPAPVYTAQPPPPATTQVYADVATEPAPTVPTNIYVYPHTTYRGRDAYIVDGRWYYATPRGWVILRQEPDELARYRASIQSGWMIEGYPVERVAVPSDIGRYPHFSYGGSYAYLVGGRWYYPSPQGWVRFREEPRELSRYRTSVITTQGTEVGGYLVDPAPRLPPDIGRRPRAPFRGSTAYFVEGRWYFPTARGWVVFREEPRELMPYRRDIERRGGRYYGYPR